MTDKNFIQNKWAKNRKQVKEHFFENFSYKVVALLITLILWITVLGGKDATVSEFIKIDFALPNDLVISNPVTNKVQIQVEGSRLALKKLSKKFKPIVLDLKDVSSGRTVVSIPTEKLGIPFGTKVVSVTPPSLVLDIERIKAKWIPIHVDWDSVGDPDKRVHVSRIKPSGLRVRGASSVLSRIDRLWTESVNVQQIPFGTDKKVVEIRTQIKELNYPGILPFEDNQVSVFVKPKK